MYCMDLLKKIILNFKHQTINKIILLYISKDFIK